MLDIAIGIAAIMTLRDISGADAIQRDA